MLNQRDSEIGLRSYDRGSVTKEGSSYKYTFNFRLTSIGRLGKDLFHSIHIQPYPFTLLVEHNSQREVKQFQDAEPIGFSINYVSLLSF